MPKDLAGTWQRMQQELSTVVETESEDTRRSVTKLLTADVLHQATVGRNDRGNIERYVYIMALRAFLDLVAAEASPDLKALTVHLSRLMVDLEDLDRGHVARGLRPRTRSRQDAGPRSRRESTLRGHLAGIVEGLMRRGGMSEPEAAHWVLRRLSAHRVQVTQPSS